VLVLLQKVKDLRSPVKALVAFDSSPSIGGSIDSLVRQQDVTRLIARFLTKVPGYFSSQSS
jgi:hypothetical protein